MIKSLACLALLAAVPLAQPAEAAAHCPDGQMYRVSLHVCAPRAKNLRFLHQSGKDPATAQSAPNSASTTVTVVPKSDPAALSRAEAAARLLETDAVAEAPPPSANPYAPAEAPPPSASAYAPAETYDQAPPSPWGVLRPLSDFR